MSDAASTPARQVGLIGLGLMGRGIGHSLLRAGHRLGVMAHRRREVADELTAAGAWEAPNPRALAESCDTVVLCVSSAEAAIHCVLGDAGIHQGAHTDLLVIESSTLMPRVALHLNQQLRDVGAHFVDAPVTRGPREAMAGQLNALVGADACDLDNARPVLAAYCERVFHLGAVGQGYAGKLINNFLAFSHLVSAAEAMTTAARAGLELSTLLQAIAVSGGQNRVLDGLGPWLTTGTPPRSQVTLSTAHKDLAYFDELARSLGTTGPVAQQALRSLSDALAAGLGGSFTPDYLQHVARSAGVTLPPPGVSSG